MDILRWILFFVIVLTAGLAIRFSLRAKKASDPRERGLLAGKVNVNMGVMLVSMSIIQMFYFQGSIIRVLIGALFLLLGLFNFFAGYKNVMRFKMGLSQRSND